MDASEEVNAIGLGEHEMIPYEPIHQTQDNDLKIKVLVQPDDVQVKRVGRASCIEPELKVSLETDSLYPQTVVINAYLKVLGKDNKYKMILLRKSDEILMTKVHRRENINMKLRFLKTIKVQVLKRNLGVARPEASVVFEVVNRHGAVLSAQETTHFAIISDPRYLDEVKKRRVGERGDAGESDEETYQPPNVRAMKRRRHTEYEGPVSSSGHPHYDHMIKQEPSSPSSSTSPSYEYPSPSGCASSPYTPPADAPISSPPIYLTPLHQLKNVSDVDLFADSEEEYKLIKLVESLKYGGCGRLLYNFQMMPSFATI